MSVPLTVTTRVRRAEEPCSRCSTQTFPVYRVVVSHEGGNDEGDPLCEECFKHPSVVLLQPMPSTGNGGGPSRYKKKSQQRERKIAAAIGGRAQPASGALPGLKGDVRLRGRWRIDDKTSRSHRFILTRDIIDKIRSECGMNENFAITIGFLDSHTQREEEEVVVISMAAWEKMIRADLDR